MDKAAWIFGAATLLATIGIWLLLPRGGRSGRVLGTVLSLVALGLVGSQLAVLSCWGKEGVLLLLSIATVVSAAATVTSRNPVYSAIWFGMVLLGTAGLFLFQGAQFLGIATIIVYAGAILVTFLFVIMLAQPEGHAYYDRLSWEAMLSAATGAVLVGMLTMAVTLAFRTPEGAVIPAKSAEETATELAQGILAQEHVARFGAQMFSKHLVAIEVAGALLLAALVGAVAMIAHGKEEVPQSDPITAGKARRTIHGR